MSYHTIKYIFINLTYYLLFLIVVYLASEVGLRLLSQQRNFYSIEILKFAKELQIADPLGQLSHVNKPNASGKFMGVDIFFNSLGYRENELGTKKDNEKRALLLGSSQSLGWGVEVKDTFPKILEDKLNISQISPSKNTLYRIINAATVNYGICDQLVYLQRQPEQVAYDMLIIQTNKFIFLDRKEINSSAIFKYSYLSAFLFQRYLMTIGIISNIFSTPQPIQPLDIAHLPNVQCLIQMDAFLKSINKFFLVFLTPDYQSLNETDPAVKMLAQLEGLLDQKGISVLNMIPSFLQKYGGSNITLTNSKDDDHPNRLAHQFQAEILYNYIRVKWGQAP